MTFNCDDFIGSSFKTIWPFKNVFWSWSQLKTLIQFDFNWNFFLSRLLFEVFLCAVENAKSAVIHSKWSGLQWGSVNHQMAVPVPSVSCCVFNNNYSFYQEPNELAFNRDTCCYLVICLQLIASHWKVFWYGLASHFKVFNRRWMTLKQQKMSLTQPS